MIDKDFLDTWEAKAEAWHNSEEGQEYLRQSAKKIINEEATLNSQLERFHEKHGEKFQEFVNKVQEKYNSDKYRDHWYGRGFEPPEDLYWFLYNYAQKYGRETTKEEDGKIDNDFYYGGYVVNGICFSSIHGQGSFIQINWV